MSRLSARKIIGLAGALLFAEVVFLKLLDPDFLEQSGGIRIFLAILFPALILLRPKTDTHVASSVSHSRYLTFVAPISTLLLLAGLIMDIHQVEWLGLLGLLYACLRFALPGHYHRDLLLSLCLLYFMHPIPGSVYGGVQRAMQAWSVAGAESVLHALNVRVWMADMVLHTGFSTFEVPAACSGMKTGVTVFLSCLGVGILYRLPWYQGILFGLLGMTQALILNVMRISFMVHYAGKFSYVNATTFLHDSLGVFMLLAIMVVQLEIILWQKWRKAHLSYWKDVVVGNAELPDKASRFPRFWTFVFKWGLLGLGVVLIVLFVSGFIYKQRPLHRASMIVGAADGLTTTNPSLAERAYREVLALDPTNTKYRYEYIRVLLIQKKFESALEQVISIEPDSDQQDTHTVYHSWALVGCGAIDEAVALVSKLPKASLQHPGLAMVLAEFAAFQDKPKIVAENITLASEWAPMVERVEALYPYLASRGQWKAIADADMRVKYNDPELSWLMITAHLNSNSLNRAGDLLQDSLGRWPDDTRFLRQLLFLARQYSDVRWKTIFSDYLIKGLNTLDAAELSYYLVPVFQLDRPDIGWYLYHRLEHLAPSAPSLHYAPASAAPFWFTFRNHDLGLKADYPEETLHAGAFFETMKNIEPWNSISRGIPHFEPLAVAPDLKPFATREFALCKQKLLAIQKSRQLDFEEGIMLSRVYEAEGRPDLSLQQLQDMKTIFSMQEETILFEESGIYARTRQFDQAYEKLHDFDSRSAFPRVSSRIQMVNALMHLGLGSYAMNVAQDTLRQFPDSTGPLISLASLWDVYGFKEEAFFSIEKVYGERPLDMLARLLVESGRLSHPLARKQNHLPGQTRMILPPAEMSIALRSGGQDADVEKINKAEWMKRTTSASPFVRNLAQLVIAWNPSSSVSVEEQMVTWAGIGRSDWEKAAALGKLSALFLENGMIKEAEDVSAGSLKIYPRALLQQRMNIALQSGDISAVEQAYMHFPYDSEIWLAHLMTMVKEGQSDDQLLNYLRGMLEKNRVSSGTLIRAGDYLLRHRRMQSVRALARHVMASDKHFLPAYVLGIRAGLIMTDPEWAVSCASQAVSISSDPTQFYRVIYDIRTNQKKLDLDYIRSLEFLSKRFPDERKWRSLLAEAYFMTSDWSGALTVLSKASIPHPESLTLRDYLLAAEAARMLKRNLEAIQVLKRGEVIYPGNMHLRNNLIYTMAQSPETLNSALTLLPDFLERAGESALAFDTASVVYMKAGKYDKAVEYNTKAISMVSEDSPAWPDIALNTAWLHYYLRDYSKSGSLVKRLLSDKRVTGLGKVQLQDLQLRLESQPTKL